MQSIAKIIALAICFCIATVQSAALSTDDTGSTGLVPTADNVAKTTFGGEINGTLFTMTGTFSEFLAGIEAQFPGHLESQSQIAERAPVTLNKRNKDGLICIPSPGNPRWGMAKVSNLNQMANDMMAHHDHWMEISGRECGRLNCFDGDGVWLCNDNKFMIRPQVNYLGTYVADIAAHCGNGVYAGGQEFDTDHYNILARHGCDLFTYNI